MKKVIRVTLILVVIALDYMERGAHGIARWLKHKAPHIMLVIAIMFLYLALILQKIIGYLLKKIDALEEG